MFHDVPIFLNESTVCACVQITALTLLLRRKQLHKELREMMTCIMQLHPCTSARRKRCAARHYETLVFNISA